MSTVQEIEAAIAKLSAQEFDEIARRIEERCEATWERRMEAEVASGQLDEEWMQAQREIGAGETTSLDAFLSQP